MKTSTLLLLLSFFIVVIPILFQLKMGKVAIKKGNKRMFENVFILSIVSQFIFTFISIAIQWTSFEYIVFEQGKEYSNIPPPIGGVPLSFILGVIIICIYYFQSKRLEFEIYCQNRKSSAKK